jgi:hypothetical protein
MNRQTYRRHERENGTERPAGRGYQSSGGCFDYTAESVFTCTNSVLNVFESCVRRPVCAENLVRLI